MTAEYAANGAVGSPQKEYGYRNGQLLITAEPVAGFNGYASRRSITIDHSKVPNTDQSNFPVLISGTYSYLATTANGGSVQNANGYDVIFGVAAEARTAYFDFQNGTFTAQVEVVLSDRGGGNLAVDVAHEGRHVADAQEFAAALTADVAANGAKSTAAIMGATNRTRYEREVRGYTVSSLVARGLGLDNLNITPSNGRNYEIWNRGWRNVDRERLRGINNLLRESPTYGLTPANQGQRYITP